MKTIKIKYEEIEDYNNKYAFWKLMEEKGFPVKYHNFDGFKIHINGAYGQEFANILQMTLAERIPCDVKQQVKQNIFDCTTDVCFIKIKDDEANMRYIIDYKEK